MNSTNATNVTTYDDSEAEFHVIGGIFILGLAFLSISTVLTNGMFLLTFYKDPLKCLRTPSAIFIAGLTSANFLTGLIVEPALLGEIVLSFVYGEDRSLSKFYRLAEVLSFVTVTSSFLIMLALGIVQYLLIKHPRVYQRAVSVKSAVIGVIFIFVYSIFFAVLPEMTGINKYVYYLIDLAIHETLLTVALVILYMVIYCAFRKLTQRHRSADLGENAEGQGSSAEQTENEKQRRQAEKDFVIGTITLTLFLIITVWPYCITLFIAMLYDFTLAVFIAVIIAQFFLLWKFALDPFVFAWRLRKYRKSLVLVMQRICPCGKPSVPGARYQRQGSSMAVPQSEPDDDDVDVTVVDSSGQTQQQAAIV